MSRILIGTASWTDKSLIASGRFYPSKSNSAEERLRYYASQFPIVEVDSSYYAMPSPQVAQLWAERTPPEFTFNIKAFRLFTGHQTSPADKVLTLQRCTPRLLLGFRAKYSVRRTKHKLPNADFSLEIL